MGYGGYSIDSRSMRSKAFASAHGHASINSMNSAEIFTKKGIDNAMNPKGIVVRECKDSPEHPNSVPVIIGLDMTGSMGQVPLFLVTEGLPHIVSSIIQGGEPHPQLL